MIGKGKSEFEMIMAGLFNHQCPGVNTKPTQGWSVMHSCQEHKNVTSFYVI